MPRIRQRLTEVPEVRAVFRGTEVPEARAVFRGTEVPEVRAAFQGTEVPEGIAILIAVVMAVVAVTAVVYGLVRDGGIRVGRIRIILLTIHPMWRHRSLSRSSL
jgi:hypothetical protein